MVVLVVAVKPGEAWMGSVVVDEVSVVSSVGLVKGAATPRDGKSRVLELPRVLVRSEDGVGTIKRRRLLLLLMAVMTGRDGVVLRDCGGDDDVVVMLVRPDGVAMEEDVFVGDEESETGLSCDEDRLRRGERFRLLLLL